MLPKQNLETINPCNLIQENSEESECLHENLKDDICIDCGYCIDNIVLQSTARSGYACKSSIPMKYVVKNPMKVNDESIKKILIPLGLECYTNSVRDLLSTIKFNCRIKREDKVIVTIYHILKNNQFPIALIDLLKFSSMTKWKLLKVHRDVFGFISQSDEYLFGIFNRIMNFLDKNSHPNTGSFETYRNLHKMHINSDPKSLCMAYFLENNRLSTLIIKNNDEYDFYQVENIRKKLRKKANIT